jgi:hypothetical protein
VYREHHRLEHTGSDGDPIQVSTAPDLSRLTVEEKRQLVSLLEKADAEIPPPRGP